MPVLFVFVDGVGAGARDPAVNPLARVEHLLSRFADGGGAPLPAGGASVLADARLGVPGRPQSATGQTTILTGENAPRAPRHATCSASPTRRCASCCAGARSSGACARRGAGRLRQRLPGGLPEGARPALRGRARGEAAQEPAAGRPSATTVAFEAGGGRFRTWDDAGQGRALTADLTAARARTYGARRRGAHPGAGGRRAARPRPRTTTSPCSSSSRATRPATPARWRARWPSWAGSTPSCGRWWRASLRRVSLLVASDHGNVEDLSLRNHTLAPVPVLGFGPAARRLHEVHDLTGLAPLLLDLAGPG